MYDKAFFRTRLGQAAMASIAVMACFAALSTQIAATRAPMLATLTLAQIA